MPMHDTSFPLFSALFIVFTNTIIVVHAHLPTFLHHDIFHFCSSKSFQTGCHHLVFVIAGKPSTQPKHNIFA